MAEVPAETAASPAHPVIAPVAIAIEASAAGRLSGLIDAPPQPRAAYVLAHGAGAGMTHRFLATVAAGLAARGIACLRFNFSYMEEGSKRPDAPAIAHAAVRAAVAEAGRRWPGLPLAAGGKSFGGRMTSQAQAAEPLPGVSRLAFIGFPLHPAGRPAIERADHLGRIAVPMLFLQGSRDELAEIEVMRGVIAPLGARGRLQVFDDADHSFHVRARSGSTDAAVMATLLDALAAWVAPA